MTSTCYDRLPYDPDRPLPSTLYASYPVGSSPQNTLKIHGCVLWLLPVTTDYFIYVLHKNWGSGRPARYLRLRPGRALPTVRIIVPSSPMVSVWPNITVQTISEGYLVIGHSLIERVTILLYLAVYEHNWILYVTHSKSTQIRPVFYIYTHERSLALPPNKHYSQHPIYFSNSNYTLISLQFTPILGNHPASYMIYTAEQRRFIQVFT